jgi:hypothetical protein
VERFNAQLRDPGRFKTDDVLQRGFKNRAWGTHKKFVSRMARKMLATL